MRENGTAGSREEAGGGAGEAAPPSYRVRAADRNRPRRTVGDGKESADPPDAPAHGGAAERRAWDSALPRCFRMVPPIWTETSGRTDTGTVCSPAVGVVSTYTRRVDLTRSFVEAVSPDLQQRYVFREVRNAAAILKATNPSEFSEMEVVLKEFILRTTDLVEKGGQESKLAARLNEAFRSRGWREARVDTEVRLALRKMAYKPAGEKEAIIAETETRNEGYKVDNFRGRVALDVEWNAKDGNLDRDISAYRSLYDAGLIDGAVIVTRTLELREFGKSLGLKAGLSDSDAGKILNTTTTTNLAKLQPRLSRGDSGGCPLLVIAISERTWDGTAPENLELPVDELKAAAESSDEDDSSPIESASDSSSDTP